MSFREYTVKLIVWQSNNTNLHTWIRVKASCEEQAEQIAYSTTWEKFKWLDQDENVVKNPVIGFYDNDVEIVNDGFNENVIKENNSYFNYYEALGYAVINYERDFIRSKEDVR